MQYLFHFISDINNCPCLYLKRSSHWKYIWWPSVSYSNIWKTTSLCKGMCCTKHPQFVDNDFAW